MSRKKSPCSVPIGAAAEILGMDVQTLRLCMQQGYYKDIGVAALTADKHDCHNYEISKYKLFQRQGLDVKYSIDETIALIRAGTPPFVPQVPPALLDLWDQTQKKILTEFGDLESTLTSNP